MPNKEVLLLLMNADDFLTKAAEKIASSGDLDVPAVTAVLNSVETGFEEARGALKVWQEA